MTMSVEAAAQALREAMRETVRRYSTWYLIQGVLMVIGGIVALIYPFVSSVALVLFLGWILIITGIFQGISLIGSPKTSRTSGFNWCLSSYQSLSAYSSLGAREKLLLL